MRSVSDLSFVNRTIYRSSGRLRSPRIASQALELNVGAEFNAPSLGRTGIVGDRLCKGQRLRAQVAQVKSRVVKNVQKLSLECELNRFANRDCLID